MATSKADKACELQAPLPPARDPRWEALAAPFPPDQVEKLERGKGVVLDYVGHAGITMRLNEVDPCWNWEPLALDPQGLPLFTTEGLWIKLTILGVTRLAFGDAQGKKAAAVKFLQIHIAARDPRNHQGIGLLQLVVENARGELADLSAWPDPPAPTCTVSP